MGRREGLFAVAVYLGLALGITFPVVLQVREGVAANVDGDAFDHLWGYWWVGRGVLTQQQVPFWTDLLGYPIGGRLYFIDLLGSMFMLPFSQSPALLYLGYNLLQVLQVVLAGVFTWKLCLREGADRWGAIGGGVVYAGSAYLQSTLFNGVPELAHAFVLPLGVLKLIETLDAPGPRTALPLALALALGAISSWYYGVFLALAAAVIVTWRLWVDPRPGLEPRRALGVLVGAGAGALILVAPFVARFFATLGQVDSLIDRPVLDTTALPTLIAACNDLILGLAPGAAGNLNSSGSTFLHGVFPGVLTLLLALYALAGRGARAGLGPWVALAAAGWMMSLGPHLIVWRRMLLGIPLPWSTVSDLVPVLGQIGFPYRFASLTQLALAVMVGRAVAALVGGLGVAPRVVSLGLVALLAVEQVGTSPVRWPRPVAALPAPSYAGAFSRAPEGLAVLDLPYPDDELMHQLCIAHYTWAQVLTNRPIPYRVNFSPPASAIDDLPFVYTLKRAAVDRRDKWSLIEVDAVRRQLWDLHELGFGWIVYHSDLYARHPDAVQRLGASAVYKLLQACCKSVSKTADAEVFAIPAPRTSRRDGDASR